MQTSSDFLKSKPCLRCPKLNGVITRVNCVKRMVAPKPGRGTYGSKKPDNCLDAYCRTGECPIGQETIKVLGVDNEYAEWRAAADEEIANPKKKEIRPPADLVLVDV